MMTIESYNRSSNGKIHTEKVMSIGFSHNLFHSQVFASALQRSRQSSQNYDNSASSHKKSGDNNSNNLQPKNQENTQPDNKKEYNVNKQKVSNEISIKNTFPTVSFNMITPYLSKNNVDTAKPEKVLQSARAQELRSLIERCINFAITNEESSGLKNSIYIELPAELFSNTTLSLHRKGKDQGWQLTISSESSEYCDSLNSAAGELKKYFAEKNLGDISITVNNSV